MTTSRDHTPLAYDLTGQGPPVILVVGAFNDRNTGAGLAAFLGSRFSVISYDRRGRGESGDTPPYAVEREIEDLEALMRVAGGAAAVVGYSSGAVLALRAAAHGLPITRLALYETPPAQPAEHAAALAALVSAGRRGEAVEYFQRRVVGIPEAVVAQLRQAPFRPALERMAHTLVHDATIMDYGSAARFEGVGQATLAIAGSASPPVMRDTAAALAASMPLARSFILEGATHDIVPAALGPVLAEFLAEPGSQH